MNLLLDSHALLWALHDPDRMDASAVRTIRDPRQAVYFSAASVWELHLKAAAGKLSLPDGWVAAAHEAGFVELAVTAAHAAASVVLPWHHRDPFDRLLVAQALEHDLRIASRDSLLGSYDVALLTV
ncbi:MAG: type II toxin-antitoxin system VapC family toxin [Gemmatimonadetes bacterium]|nr:type II toxin-antitoxin system VapC family toxin [Gemmatimonadota bacterium]